MTQGLWHITEAWDNLRSAYTKHIAALLLFGSNGLVASFIKLSSREIVLLRTLLGSLTMALIFLLTRSKFTFPRKKRAFIFLCLSGICTGASWLFLYEGYVRLGVSIATLCNYCGPVIVMALSPLLFKEKLTPAKLIGFAAALCGVCFINGKVVGSGDVFGLVCGIMSAVTYAFMIIFKKLSAEIDGIESTMFQLIWAFVTVAVFVGMTHGYALPIAKESLPAILILGIVNTGIVSYMYFSSMGKLPVQSVAVLGYIEPLSAIFFSVLLLHEVMLPLQIVGGILIIGGAAAAELLGKKKAS